MKHIYILLFIILSFFSCKAQTTIIDMNKEGLNDIPGSYYKDVNNELDPFIGTYVYQNGNTTLKIVLRKMVMSSMNDVYFEDLIIGEILYIEQGVEKINSLDKLNTNYINGSNYSINGNTIHIGKVLGCTDCGNMERRLEVSFYDEVIDKNAELNIRRTAQSGQQAIKLSVGWRSYGVRHENDPPLPEPRIPNGDYILIKEL